jgi:hypothetical protein
LENPARKCWGADKALGYAPLLLVGKLAYSGTPGIELTDHLAT